MKTVRLFSIAALAFVMVACTSNEIEIPQQDGKMHFTATIAAPSSDTATKTVYTENESTINVAWRAKEDGVYEGDQIALIHNGVKDVATVVSVDGSGNATIEATITGKPVDGDDVVLVYPAASVNATGSGTGFTPDVDYAQKGFDQNGTLDYIQEYLDGRQGSGKLSVSGATATLKGSVKMNSQIAIWKLTLQDNATTPNALSASAVTVTVGTIPVAAASASAKSKYYLCLVPAALSSGVLTISATVGSDTYLYTKEGGVTLEAGKYYQSTVTMTKVPSYDRTVNINDGGTGEISVTANQHWLIEGNGTAVNRTIIIEDGATVTIAGVNIKAENKNAIKCLGNAGIVLSGENIVTSESGDAGDKGTLAKAVIQAGTYEPTKTTLTISGDGILNANPVYPSGATSKNHNGAVIGADYEGSCGNIVINSGTINVSNNYGASIGSGRVGSGTSKCGSITINGGTISATSSTGAGIGSGGRESGKSGTTSCDGITINGGKVTARSVGGAAIGAGKCEGGGTNSDSYCGNIVITGGTVDAQTTNTGDYAGAAIGGGYHSKAGNITISGGNVKAFGHRNSAGIGAGGRNSQCGNILINGGSVDAQGGYGTYEGAGIGTGKGSNSNAKSTCGTITITSGVTIVKAKNVYGNDNRKSIGKGSLSYVSCGTVTINGVTGEKSGATQFIYEPGAGS